MYRYQGNTGQYVWVPDGEPPETVRPPTFDAVREPGRSEPDRPPPERKKPLPWEPGSGLSNILSSVFPDGFEMEDALLLLTLFLLYRESGDKELLIIMGAMFLL